MDFHDRGKTLQIFTYRSRFIQQFYIYGVLTFEIALKRFLDLMVIIKPRKTKLQGRLQA